MISWKRWFAWRPVRLQFTNSWVWLGWVEREVIDIPICSAMHASETVTHYRMAL